MKTILCILTAATLLCGCNAVHVGNNFDASKVALIKNGETTEPQLITLFGQPNQRITNSQSGVSLAWIYSAGQSGFGGATSSNKTLVVWLGQTGIVTNYNYSTGAFNSTVK
jgi:predicted RecA/RadA family phage recombinase